jgi:signal transduction histidine kinase
MPVDISDILHVLAHELRTPVGIAHGYVRLLLEDRLPQEVDRRRALEQMQKALGRLTELSHESSRLATWWERDDDGERLVPAAEILGRVDEVGYDFPVTVDRSRVPASACIRTDDADTLVTAIASLVRATARELRGQPCDVVASVSEGRFLDVLVGPPDRLAALGAVRGTSEARAIALERGGLGLALVHAALVLDAHGAERWTMNDSRQTAGFRLPFDERSLS